MPWSDGRSTYAHFNMKQRIRILSPITYQLRKVRQLIFCHCISVSWSIKWDYNITSQTQLAHSKCSIMEVICKVLFYIFFFWTPITLSGIRADLLFYLSLYLKNLQAFNEYLLQLGTVQWLSDISMNQNHQESLLKNRFLDCIPMFSD